MAPSSGLSEIGTLSRRIDALAGEKKKFRAQLVGDPQPNAPAGAGHHGDAPRQRPLGAFPSHGTSEGKVFNPFQ